MNEELRHQLYQHLQTAIDIELSTIPIYLFTYYSINRIPSNTDGRPNGQQLATFANKAGGLIMSVAVEEMLHMSLASNILRALGGEPKLYCRSPGQYPTNLPHHKAGFEVSLAKLSSDQLGQFLGIELPEKKHAPPEGNNWETIGQFYEYIEGLIQKTCDADYVNIANQLPGDKNFYAPNNVDTVYPKDAYYIREPENPFDPVARGADQAEYPNKGDSGHLMRVHNKGDALRAIHMIMHQGEGYPGDDKFDDPSHKELTHWYKYQKLQQEIATFSEADQKLIIYNFPVNPQVDNYPAQFASIVNLTNATYSYLFLMTETAFRLDSIAQASLFFIGMHKGMIFILDKIIRTMQNISLNNPQGQILAPTFENWSFDSLASAKQELVGLCRAVPVSLGLSGEILQRIQDLPDVNVGPDGMVRF